MCQTTKPHAYHCQSLDTVAKTCPPCLKVIVASAKLIEASSDLALESPRKLMVPHSIQIVLLSKNNQHLSNSWLNNYKILFIFPHVIQFC